MSQTSPTPLAYAAPADVREVRIEKTRAGVMIEMGPPSRGLFLTMLVPWVIALIGATIFAILLVQERPGVAGPKAWVVAPLAIIVGVFMVWRMARYRNIRRVIEVRDGMLGYGDAGTAGQMIGIAWATKDRLRVRRSWWRPWIVQLIVLPDVGFWSTKTGVEPAIVLSGTDRRQLERIATELRQHLR
jgi:hypothetical protein